MSKDLSTDTEITWCLGCGNFGILNALKKTVKKLEEKGVKQNHIIISSGIGCHGKIFDYVGLSGIYSIHGRSTATAQGIKLANPDLKVISFSGDGDAYGEGIAHMIFAAKRNADITVAVHNNGTYALTTGQFSPTSKKGFKGPSMPEGNVENPLNPLSLLLEAGATFIARGYAGKIDQLSDILVEAVLHEGFSVVDVLQPSVVFNDTYELFNEITEVVSKPAESIEDAISLVKKKDKKLPIGVFYKVKKPVFHKELMDDWNPIKNKIPRTERLKKIKDFFN
ncbi:MAG: thiamine pyrophosphate-dependent enzyme [Candidatus Thermoplasmatota archaeon]|nr:thiamine pyrophosphate-dependent enzyme [Candidatus Thermoplasmatota archaeon]